MPARKKTATKKGAKRTKRTKRTSARAPAKKKAAESGVEQETAKSATTKKGAMKQAAAKRAAAAVGGAATIIYVHGIGNKPPASVLKQQWDEALFEFDLGERSRMAYWVDRERYPTPLDIAVSGGDFADGSEDAPRGEFSPKAMYAPWNVDAELQRVDTVLGELVDARNEPTASDKQQRRLRSLAGTMLSDNALTDDAQYAKRTEAMQGPGARSTRRLQAQRYGAAAVQAKIFSFLPRPMRQWLTRNVTRMFLRDVNDLFVDKEKGDRMRSSLKERLLAGGGPFVIVAHSQGSMIAYAVLMDEELADIDVPLFVTIGSPLGIDEVQDFIRDLTRSKRLVVPPTVGKWINVCDPLDPVALDKSLEGEFEPNARNVRVQDRLVFNPDSPRHPHSGTGYLALEVVRQPVRECVNTALFQPVSQFKMAKDVVRAFADSNPGERHRILVQLADYATTDMNREDALACIYDKLGAPDEDGPERQHLEAEELQRYVALSLTRLQAETLSSEAHGEKKFPVARLWKNGAKRAYLDRSIHTTQAFPAHNSYQAAGLDITWAVLDSGIHYTHPHFNGTSGSTIARVYDCTSAAERRRPRLRELDMRVDRDADAAADQYGHGAHVAGIIAGRHTATDAEGKPRAMCGMAPEAKLAIYKVLDNNGSGEDSWIIKALDDIFDTNERAGSIVVHGVNLSLGGEFDVEAFNCGHTPLCVELRRLWRQGVIVVLSAGNEGFASLRAADGENVQANMGMSLGDPANLEEAIVVGSVHKDSPHTYGTSFFSSRGPTADGRMKPDCVAPGERILSVRSDVARIRPNMSFEQLYTEMSGTSMAAPHVSGLIAAFLSKRREFIGRPDEVKAILLRNCTDLQRQRNMQGAGMPNLVKMLVNV